MTLSADTLNQRSPYALIQLGELTFRFVTDQQIHYTVGFYDTKTSVPNVFCYLC